MQMSFMVKKIATHKIQLKIHKIHLQMVQINNNNYIIIIMFLLHLADYMYEIHKWRLLILELHLHLKY